MSATEAQRLQGNLPHFPDPKDPDQRIRMGCPVDGENLRWRYRNVTGGSTPASWDDDDFRNGYSFEWALADIMACSVCNAKGAADCRSVHGHRYFMELQHARTAQEGKPHFTMTYCGNIVTRKAQIEAQIARGQVEYRD